MEAQCWIYKNINSTISFYSNDYLHCKITNKRVAIFGFLDQDLYSGTVHYSIEINNMVIKWDENDLCNIMNL